MFCPFFTFITVTLNPEIEDLKRTIASVQNQDFSNWELIIKDGGSNNGCLDVIPHDNRIKLISMDDLSIYDAMNQAINCSSGDYICMLNAGDFLFENTVLSKLEKAISGMSNVDFIFGDVHKPQSRTGFEHYPNKLSRFFLFSNMICHQSWFVSSSYYKGSGGYDLRFKYHSDYLFFLKMVIEDDVKYFHFPKVLVTYKGGGVSQGSESKLETMSSNWNEFVIVKYFTYWERFFFTKILFLRKTLKTLFYDDFLSKIWVAYKKLKRKTTN